MLLTGMPRAHLIILLRLAGVAAARGHTNSTLTLSSVKRFVCRVHPVSHASGGSCPVAQLGSSEFLTAAHRRRRVAYFTTPSAANGQQAEASAPAPIPADPKASTSGVPVAELEAAQPSPSDYGKADYSSLHSLEAAAVDRRHRRPAKRGKPPDDAQLTLWITRELQALILDEDVALLLQHVQGVLKRMYSAKPTNGPAPSTPGSVFSATYGSRDAFLGSVAQSMEQFLQEFSAQFAAELWVFLHGGLTVAAFDEALNSAIVPAAADHNRPGELQASRHASIIMSSPDSNRIMF